MVELEYRLGGMKVNPDTLFLDIGLDAYDANHKYVVRATPSALELYVGRADTHSGIVKLFRLMCEPVAGGSVYIDTRERLVVGDYSVSYGSMTRDAAQRFAKLLMHDLLKKGVPIRGIVANPNERKLNPFWR